MTSFWHPIWTSWVPLDAIFGALWRLMDHLGTVLDSLGAILEPPGAILGRLGASLWPSWSLLLPSWDLLGHLEPTGSPYGHHFVSIWVDFGSILGPFWIHFWHFKINLHQPKLNDFVQHHRKLIIWNGNQNQPKSTHINQNQSKSIKNNPIRVEWSKISQSRSHPEPRFLESQSTNETNQVNQPTEPAIWTNQMNQPNESSPAWI